MREFLKKKGIAIAAAALAVALILGIATYTLGGRSDFVTNAVNAVMRPVGSGVAVIADFMEGLYGYMFEYDRLKTENNDLKAKIADMEQQIRDSAAANEENKRLRRLLELREKRADFELESAYINSWGSSNWSSTFTINKGSGSGIELLDCVITEHGYLVGQVIKVGPSTATVRTIIDTNMNAGALIERTGISAVASGDFEKMREGKLKLTFIPDGAEILNGDTILTSGKGESIPKGLVVGKVTDAGLEPSALTQYAVISPSAALTELTQVFVIKSFDIVE
ncbi:MAG: rod shape-determining protein MreC [Clostridiales bacterium]|nr:rod shape-determining protein MreC [Clostridiales bacterium]